MCGLLGEVAFVAEAVGADYGWRTWSLFIVGNAHIGSSAVGGGGVGWRWLACWCLLVPLVVIWRSAGA